MRLGASLVLALAAACSFERASLDPGGAPPDGPVVEPGADAPPADPPDAEPGVPDASPPDACVPEDEQCNGMDDDCDGVPDDGLNVGAPCDGGDSDVCVEGVVACDAFGTAVCSDLTGSTVETCNAIDDDCDGTNNEGFDLLGDEANCGACGNGCTNTFGTTQCLGGTCTPSCSAGAMDCDGDPDDGCELRNSSPSCAATVTNLGAVDGNTPGTSVSVSGFGEAFFLIDVEESNFAAYEALTARVDLANPPDVDFDIHLYCLGCGGAFVGSTLAAAGATDTISVGRSDADGISDYQILVEVRLYEADACGNWTLTVYGDESTSDTSCD